jgi:hypothetical protein
LLLLAFRFTTIFLFSNFENAASYSRRVFLRGLIVSEMCRETVLASHPISFASSSCVRRVSSSSSSMCLDVPDRRRGSTTGLGMIAGLIGSGAIGSGCFIAPLQTGATGRYDEGASVIDQPRPRAGLFVFRSTNCNERYYCCLRGRPPALVFRIADIRLK